MELNHIRKINKMYNTKQIIAGMLTENVGRHFLGGTPRYDANGKYIGSANGYGRRFEANQGRSFDDEPSTTIKFEIYNGKLDISVTHNVYHWLKKRCTLDVKLDKLFHGRFLKEVDADDDKHWMQLMGEFPAWVEKRVVVGTYSVAKKQPEGAEYGKIGGIYGEGEPMIVNTYNGEDMLSQVLQYVYFTWDREEYFVLQIHGGADVRGGYTKPRVFICDDLSIFDNAKGSIYCTGKDHHPTALAIKEFQEAQLAFPGIETTRIDFDHCESNWYTDDSCNWYEDGACGGKHVNLEDMECRDLDADVEDDEPPLKWEPGIVCISDGVGYCPRCGARLAASD